jgi:glycogen operon protein
LSEPQENLFTFVKKLIRIRAEQPVLRRRQFFQGRPIRGSEVKDVSWLEPSGREMPDAAWNSGFVRCVGMLLAGNQINELDDRGQRVDGDTLLLLLNAHHGPIPFTLPRPANGWWDLVFDTAKGDADEVCHSVGDVYELADRSMVMFRFWFQEDPKLR